MLDRFSSIIERISAEPQGFCTDKVKKTVIRGLLPEEDLEHIADVLVNKQDSMSKEEMALDIGKIDMLTPEAASVLVSAWFDGGRNKIQWEKKDLYSWIKQKLVTKMGSDRLASIVAGKKVASEYGLLNRVIELRGIDDTGMWVMVSYPVLEDTDVGDCKYDIDMLVKLWKNSLPLKGGYRMSGKVNKTEFPMLEFTVMLSWDISGNVPSFESVRDMVEV